MLNWKLITMVALSGAGVWTWVQSRHNGKTYLDWSVPRTVRTTSGRVYENVTIRSLTPDGGVVINHRGSSIKFPSGSFSEAIMEEIINGNRGGSGEADKRIGGNTLLDRRPTRVIYTPNAAPMSGRPSTPSMGGGGAPSQPVEY